MVNVDKKDFHWFMGVKFLFCVALYQSLAWWLTAIIAAFFFVSYRHIVAKANGLTVMPLTDLSTFVTNPNAPTNIVSACPISKTNMNYARETFGRMVKTHLKARSCIVRVLGDFYYQELEEKNVVDSQIVALPDGKIKTQDDLEKFVQELIITKMPLDRPQWTVYV